MSILVKRETYRVEKTLWKEFGYDYFSDGAIVPWTRYSVNEHNEYDSLKFGGVEWDSTSRCWLESKLWYIGSQKADFVKTPVVEEFTSGPS